MSGGEALAGGAGSPLAPFTPLTPAEVVALGGERVRSAHSRRAYGDSLRALARFLGAPDEAAAVAALLAAGSRGAQAVAVRFREALLAEGLAPASVNLRLSAVRSAVRLARLAGTVEWDLAVPLVRAGGPRRETRGPAVADVRRLVEAAAAQDNPVKARRDGALLRLLYDLGLRRAEISGLNREDLDLTRRTLAGLRKGGSRVVWELPEPTAAALAAWLEVRGDAPGALFVELSPKGERRRLAPGGVYTVVRALGARIGLKLWPHALRHSSITAVLEVAADRGVALPDVLPATGHARASLAVVLAYYDARRRRQGEIARWVAATVDAPALPPWQPGDGGGGGGAGPRAPAASRGRLPDH